jgi:UDP-glucose 4-epimerase
MAKFFVTGAAGFIGSHFTDRALARKHQVMGFDNLSTGQRFFLKNALLNEDFTLVEGDIREIEQVQRAVNDFKPDWVIHFAANADVRQGLERPRRDLDYNTIGTWNVVESAKASGCKNMIFSSTGSVYGEPKVFPTPESCPFPEQTSLYGASKLAGEGILAAYAHGYGMNNIVFRFVSILGPRYTHGHVFDFMRKLSMDSKKLTVLGNGKQLKSYLHIEDLMKGLWLAIEAKPQGFQVFNIGHDDALMVDQSIGYITRELRIEPRLEHTGGERGWIGDSPRIQLDCSRLKKLGWSTERSLEQGVVDTVRYLQENNFLLSEASL